MPSRQRVARHGAAALRLPEFERLEEPVYNAAFTPQHQIVAGYFLTSGAAGAIVFKVDSGARPVVFAGRVQRFVSQKQRSYSASACGSM